ncbi:hypothetical protein IID22_00470 [Patescibacteria group bacterium]|nr:hypothetical protein [Patescibacteria group bacterium]
MEEPTEDSTNLDSTKTTITFTTTIKLKKKLILIAKIEDRSRSKVLERLLKEAEI